MTGAAHNSEENVNHPFFARVYLRMASSRKSRGEDEYRRKLLTGLSGRAIEVGAGSGLNFPSIPRRWTGCWPSSPSPSCGQRR